MAQADPQAMDFPYRVMHRLGEIHGSVLKVGLGSDVWVVLTGLEEIKQFTMMEETTSRPDLTSLNEIYSFGEKSQGELVLNEAIYPIRHGTVVSEEVS